ncbi:MAG: transposase [Candidatus Nitrosocosmicus sp.]
MDERMNEKWKVQNRKKVYQKIHIALNIKTKEILALEVTDKKVHDERLLKKLGDHVLNTTITTISTSLPIRRI